MTASAAVASSAVHLRPGRPGSRLLGAAIAAPTALMLAVASGAAYASGFPPLSWPIVPWFALSPLLVACASLSPTRAALAGLCWTAAAAVGVAWFLPGMLSGYFGLAIVPSWLATIAVVSALHGAYVCGYAAWVAWLVRRRAANPVLLAGGWLVCEFARTHGALGSPWALAAYSQVAWIPVIQIADLAGPYGLGMLIAAVNACAAGWMVPALRGRRPRLSAAAIGVAVAGACVYGQWRLGQTFADGEAVRVAVVQGGAPVVGDAPRAARLARHVALTTGAAARDADLIVWPEHALDGYLEEASSTRDEVLRLAGSSRGDLILGGPQFEPTAAGTRYHNSAYLVRGGRLAARYDKHRLVPFAEDGRGSWLSGAEAVRYTPGDGSSVLAGTAMRAGMLLCVEAMFPDLARLAAREGADVLVNLSNDGWFGRPEPARQQLDIATLRAVENRRYLLRAAATGFSSVIDPYGRTLAESAFDTAQVLHATVHGSRARTPYQRWGDAFAWLVIGAVAAASLRAATRATPSNDRRMSE